MKAADAKFFTGEVIATQRCSYEKCCWYNKKIEVKLPVQR
jgi:hypothetical protein